MNEIEKAIEELNSLLRAGISGLDLEMYGLISEDSFKLSILALEKRLNNGWIPFKSEHDDYYKLDMLQGKLPDEDAEIIVTDGKRVWCDTFLRDGIECFLEGGNEFISEVIAWQPLPTPYKEENRWEI